MTLDPEACYRALTAKDSRFDGHFFVGVRTTGIYCRCVCTARTPKRQSCEFFENAAAAERAGFRPCLICRPECAPGRSPVEAIGRLASVAVRRIEDGALLDSTLSEFAADLGVSGRHLRRAVMAQYGVTPHELMQTHRLLTAKRLLSDTDLPIGEVAMASGFSSLRRFNAVFHERYRLNPSAIRRARKRAREDPLTFEIGYRAPYDWDSMLGFLSARAVPGAEAVEDGCYLRTASLGRRQGWIAVTRSPVKHALRVQVSSGLAAALPQVLRRVRRLFDTSSDPCAIAEALGDLAQFRPGLRVPGAFDGFEAATRAILGQQISVPGARTLAGRLAARFGPEVETSHAGLVRGFPSAESIASASVDEIAGLGIVRKRAKALIEIAGLVAAGEIRLAPGSDVAETIDRLCRIEGVGPWTAQYIAMRALSYPDAFPHSDLGILKALGARDPKQVLALAERWRPWRAYAALHLWSTLTP
ncbi:MAG TPA: DNA-3-methyladenine glycosylase 2 [Fimbriimonadaceae bacterium]|nr:DNA-3-methyladenine glycosylase 2 [Fimbriimonadaceae bacterium]